MEAEKKRASLVERIARKPDATELAIRIQTAARNTPPALVENIIAAYLADEVKKLEDTAKKKPTDEPPSLYIVLGGAMSRRRSLSSRLSRA